MVFSSTASDKRRKGQTSPWNINVLFLQNSKLCCTAQETDRNSLLNAQTYLIFLAARTLFGEYNINRLLHSVRCLYIAPHIFLATNLEKQANQQQEAMLKCWWSRDPQVKASCFNQPEQSPSSLCQTPTCTTKLAELPKENEVKPHTVLPKATLKAISYKAIWFGSCRTEWTACFPPDD